MTQQAIQHHDSDAAMPTPTPTHELAAQAGRIRRVSLVLLAAPVIVGVILLAAVGAPVALPLLLGAAGWMLALVLRQPVALLASRKWDQDRAAFVVGAFSGPAEELVRVAMVVLAIHSFQDAAWAGFGWGAIEVLLVAVNTLVIASVLTKDDPKSREARELLEAQGMLTPPRPFWALVERLSAFALHLGFTFLLFAQPWLVLATIPAHTLTNLLAVRFAKRNLVATELALTVVGILVLVLGLAAVAL